ncbi:hypothetical protein DOE76_13890 [Leifsonia sp. ku-ls]|nr:hypothetical protein DOE76_13890 [Leifsonia sp. ku-ls]
MVLSNDPESFEVDNALYQPSTGVLTITAKPDDWSDPDGLLNYLHAREGEETLLTLRGIHMYVMVPPVPVGVDGPVTIHLQAVKGGEAK